MNSANKNDIIKNKNDMVNIIINNRKLTANAIKNESFQFFLPAHHFVIKVPITKPIIYANKMRVVSSRINCNKILFPLNF